MLIMLVILGKMFKHTTDHVVRLSLDAWLFTEVQYLKLQAEIFKLDPHFNEPIHCDHCKEPKLICKILGSCTRVFTVTEL